jgi:O-6-methylguanine DNA methyltransferase
METAVTERVVVLGPVPTPLGQFGAVLSPTGLCRLTFPADPFSLCEAWAQRWLGGARRAPDTRRLADLSGQLTAYLDGSLTEFSVPLDLRGTPFQRRVWQALLTIPHGQTRSYAALAAAIGLPGAVRAVGTANGANPVPVIVPCHRVIGSDGTLTGYGGGLPLKQYLLQLEGVHTRRPPSAPTHHQQRLPL